MKCELCGADATFHTTEVSEDGGCLPRHLCAEHARQAGYPVPDAEAMNASVISSMRSLADFLRNNRRMPSPGGMMAMGGAFGPPRADTQNDIDAYIEYLDALAEFVEQNDRFPTDDELHDPF